jgi:hypothetical protein
MKTVRLFLLINLLFLLLTQFGCSDKIYPIKFSTVQEAFSDVVKMPVPSAPSGAPESSYKTSVFNAPYEEVFRAASASISALLVNVIEEKKDSGYILGIRTDKFLNGLLHCPLQPYNSYPRERHIFYMVLVKEKGPKSTEVSILTKDQGQCVGSGCIPRVMKQNCEWFSNPHWSNGFSGLSDEQHRFLAFVRMKLLEAGVL